VAVLGLDELQEGLAHILGSPRDEGRLEMVVRRPAEDEREVVTEALIEPGNGVVGDSWSSRRSPNPDAEVTLMNARCIALLAGDVDRWPLAGDQLFVDMDLSLANLPAGTRFRIGGALLEASTKPHTGCSKFSARFGAGALRFVNSEEGRAARLRGLNARVAEGGTVRVGDAVVKLGAAEAPV
jgi:MOSC domain-containing protein YiiM